MKNSPRDAVKLVVIVKLVIKAVLRKGCFIPKVHFAKQRLAKMVQLNGLALFFLGVVSPAFAQAPLDQAQTLTEHSNQQGAAIQKRIDRYHDQTQEALAEYLKVSDKLERLTRYNKQLEQLIVAQQEELSLLDQQIQDVDVVQQGVLPLMDEMLSTLETFVSLDAPFLPDERQQRLQQVQGLMARADVSVAEKFRRLLEAYQIENEYGRTIEAYQAPLQLAEGERLVDFFRLGRLMLFYQSLDGQFSGYWDRRSQAWQPLPDAMARELRRALLMARKQTPPDLLELWLPTPASMPDSAQVSTSNSNP